MLYNFKNDDEFDNSSDIKDILEDKDEDPVLVATKCIKQMNEKYREYKKFSIYKLKN